MKQYKKVIKNRTYANFMYIVGIIQKDWHYPFDEAVEIARQRFDAWEANRKSGMSIYFYLRHLLTAEQYQEECRTRQEIAGAGGVR